MDFSNRNVQSQATASGTQAPAAGNPGAAKKNRAAGSDNGKWGRIGVVAAIAAIVILLIGVIVVAASGNSSVKAENKYVDSSKLQAVFLNTGQVYFGNIKSLNNDYFVVTNIYYLQTANNGSSSSNSNSSVTLVKLGCELHEPYDQMVINSDQVTFWENLGDNGQVAKAVKTFEKQNPDGQKCADQSTSSSTNAGSNAQNAGSNAGSNTTTTNTNKP